MSNWMVTYNSSDLMHHGIKGQRWGVRRFQNEDGSLTAAGRKRYYNTYDQYTKAKIEYSKNKTAENKARVKQLKGEVKQSWKDLDIAYRMDKGKKVSKEDMQRIIDQNKNIKNVKETYLSKVAARAEAGKKAVKGIIGGAMAAAAITGGVLYLKKNRKLRDEDNRAFEQWQNARLQNEFGVTDTISDKRLRDTVDGALINRHANTVHSYVNDRKFKTNRHLKKSIKENIYNRDVAVSGLHDSFRKDRAMDTTWSDAARKRRRFFK
ncbi:MAG: hypothetical protein J6Y02_23595 [Pseudobutyrivibrio sp.]|nr:hypothetical protein [Pseudobutyrivibrio sp.]